MAFNEQPTYLPLNKRIFYFIINIIKYPFKIAKKYETYNAGIGDLIAVKNEPKLFGDDDKYFRNFQRKNTNLIFLLIYLPMIIGFSSTGFLIYKNKENYIKYYETIKTPIKEERFTKKISSYINRISYIVMDQPMGFSEFSPLIYFYIFGILGANFLSRNPNFKKQEEIQQKLLIMGYKDINGNPWKVIYTPEALLIVSFGQDPNKIAQDAKFWTTINFPNSLPKQSKKDMNKFVVQKKVELSSDLVFKIGDIYGKR